MATVKEKAQIGMDDNVVENQELLNILRAREELKDKAAAYRTTDKDAKDKIKSLKLKFPCRVGEFLIDMKPTESREIEFTTKPGNRISIKNTNK